MSLSQRSSGFHHYHLLMMMSVFFFFFLKSGTGQIFHMHLGNTNTMQEHYWRCTGVFRGELGVCVVLPFYVPTSLPMSIVSASFLFFLQKGSLNQSNSFVRKVKATVCWHPDTRVRSGCIEKE